jgi:hypothetical protein
MSELKVTTFSSKGRVTRIQSIKNKEKKIFHLQSDNQLRAFLLFEWSDRVINIESGYPLTDLMEVIDNKDDLRLDKFMNKDNDKLYRLYTNFLLTLNNDGKESSVAVAVKNTSELKRKITIEKLEIQKRFWNAKGIELKIVTEKELNKTFCKNILWVRDTLQQDGFENKEIIAEKLYWILKANRNINVDQALKLFENANDIEQGVGLYLFRFLIATKKIKVNMKDKIKINITIEEIIIEF